MLAGLQATFADDSKQGILTCFPCPNIYSFRALDRFRQRPV